MSEEKATPERTPGFYIVIPSSVWFDARLRPNSSRLYGILSALSNAEGYCWASDGYLGEMLHQSERTVRELLKELADCGHIWVDKQGQSRRIWITPPVGENSPTGENPPEELAEIRQTSGENPPENIKSNNNTPYNPPAGDGAKKQTAEQRRETWFDYVFEIYPNHDARAPALKRWLRLKPSLEFARMIYKTVQEQVRSQKWSEGYWPEFRKWLLDERWKDPLPQASTGSSTTAVVEEPGVIWL